MAVASQASQKFVPIREVRDGIVILKDGSLRALVLASSVNFALKSQDEQSAMLAQFQSFLNTLDFSLQIYVQSRELDINPYLELLRDREDEQDNDLMKVQLREYIGFIETFTKEVDVMTKSFFVVVPYAPASIDIKGGVRRVLGFTNTPKQTPEAQFEEYRSQLEHRINVVEQGLNRLGVRTIVLGTNEVIELFYQLFNPEEHNAAPKQ